MGLLGKTAKGLADVIDGRTFFHNTNAEVSGLLEARPSRTGSGIFGLEKANANYGANSIPFKVRGKVAGPEVDDNLNSIVKEATGSNVSDYSSEGLYEHLLGFVPEQEVQAIFKQAGYGARARKSKGVDVIQAFGSDDVMQMDTPSRMARADEQGYNKDVFHYSRGGEDIEEIREGDLNLSLFDALGIHTGSKEAATKRAASTRSRNPDTGRLIDPSGPTYPLKIKHQKPLLNKDGKPYTESELHSVFAKMAEDKDYGNVWDSDVKQKLRSDLWNDYDVIPYINEVEDAGKISYISPPAAVRSKFATFDPAKTGSSNILASNPVATTGAGILGLGAAAQSNDTYADYSPSNLARLRSDDVGGYQAPQHPRLASAAMGAEQLNEQGVDDALMQFLAPRLPSELMSKIAYNDERGLLDRIKASAGLLGLY